MDDRNADPLPHSVEAEQAVLGGLMLDPEALDRIAGQLSAEDFFRRNHQMMFRAALDLSEKGQPCDAVTMGEWFDSQGMAELVAGGAYLIELATTTPSAANIRAYAQIVAEKARLRRVIEVGHLLTQAGMRPEGRSVDAILGDALRQLDGVPQSSTPGGLRGVELGEFMAAPASTIGYAVRPIVPRGVVTLWGGHGGAGKSISALQLVAHGACAEPWQGLEPDSYLRCVYVSLEDSGDLVRYRLRRVCESYHLDSGRVEAAVRVLECPDGKAALMTEVAAFGVRSMVETPLMAQLRRAVEGADLVVIDNASEAFGGNENDRQEVRAFMNALGRLAAENNAGVILLAHIDKAAARGGGAGNTYSGSTAWHNSARSRLAIIPIEPENEDDPVTVQIRHEKNNLGKRAEPITLKWNEHGVLVPLSGMDRRVREVDYTEQAYAVVRAAERLGVRLSPETTGSNPGHKAVQHLSEYVPFLAHKRKHLQFHAELQALADAGRIVKHPVKTPSRKWLDGWLPAGSACAERAPNDAPNGVPVALNDPAIPPYKTPYGGFYMGDSGDSAHHSAHSEQHSAQSGPEAKP